MQIISETKGDVDSKTGKLTTKDRNGLTTRKTKVINYLDGIGLTKDQKDVIISANELLSRLMFWYTFGQNRLRMNKNLKVFEKR